MKTVWTALRAIGATAIVVVIIVPSLVGSGVARIFKRKRGGGQ